MQNDVHITQVDPREDPHWLNFIEQSGSASVFHHPAWAKVLIESYDYEPHYLLASRRGTIVAALALMKVKSWITGRRFVSLPFSDECGPVYTDERFCAAFDRHLSTLAKSVKYVEIRGGKQPGRGVVSARYKSHSLLLNREADRIFALFKKTQTQQPIAKAIKEGVLIERSHERSALANFEELNLRTRWKHGIPPQPPSFFDKLFQHIIQKGLGFVSVAKYQDKPIAASVFLHFNKKLLYKYSASNEIYLRLRPNHLILWDAIKWGAENGLELFDFGRTDISNTGLLSFKRAWGGQERDLHYYRLSYNGERGMRENTSPAIFQYALRRLPLPILRFMGNRLYRHMG